MPWNYRVMKRTEPNPMGDGEPQVTFTVHEVFYKGDSRYNEPDGWDGGDFYLAADSVEELREHLQMMLTALDKPVLDFHDHDRENK